VPSSVRFTRGTWRDGALPTDVAAVFASGELLLRFLESYGVQVDRKFGEP
jgi:hypothetical protein